MHDLQPVVAYKLGADGKREETGTTFDSIAKAARKLYIRHNTAIWQHLNTKNKRGVKSYKKIDGVCSSYVFEKAL